MKILSYLFKTFKKKYSYNNFEIIDSQKQSEIIKYVFNRLLDNQKFFLLKQ